MRNYTEMTQGNHGSHGAFCEDVDELG